MSQSLKGVKEERPTRQSHRHATRPEIIHIIFAIKRHAIQEFIIRIILHKKWSPIPRTNRQVEDISKHNNAPTTKIMFINNKNRLFQRITTVTFY